jgi:hypothetical protein
MKSATVGFGRVLTLLALSLAWLLPAAATAAEQPPPGPHASGAAQQPRSVELEFFIGTANYPNHILLEWQSVSEQDTLGYRLFRGVTTDPDQANLLVPWIQAASPGAPQGAYYSYEDSANLTPGVVYYYWIEDQDENGVWSQHRNNPDLNPRAPWGCSVYDVVCNFVVDSEDITSVALHWNCASGDACFDVNFDVNDDLAIDMRDVMLVAGRWGCQLGQACYP